MGGEREAEESGVGQAGSPRSVGLGQTPSPPQLYSHGRLCGAVTFHPD